MSNLETRCRKCGSQDLEKTWNLELSEYQRDNLLWLLNLLGYPYPEAKFVAPFDLANTGDWVGEIAIMLADEGGNMIAEHPNEDIDTIRKRIEKWKPIA